MPAFEEAFGLPAGHTLRLVRTARRGDVWEWEHEEYDGRGALVAVYESWSRGATSPAGGRGAGGGFVKYSPHGWVLRRSDTDARRRAPSGGEKTLPPMVQPPSLRRTMQGPVG
jgi:hypothetical protein